MVHDAVLFLDRVRGEPMNPSPEFVSRMEFDGPNNCRRGLRISNRNRNELQYQENTWTASHFSWLVS